MIGTAACADAVADAVLTLGAGTVVGGGVAAAAAAEDASATAEEEIDASGDFWERFEVDLVLD